MPYEYVASVVRVGNNVFENEIMKYRHQACGEVERGEGWGVGGTVP